LRPFGQTRVWEHGSIEYSFIATAAATVLLYFALPSDEKPAPVREAHVGGLSIPENPAGGPEQVALEAACFAYPHPNSEFYTDWNEDDEEEDFLPHDYIALARALEV
jgi:hypothetical protein